MALSEETKKRVLKALEKHPPEVQKKIMEQAKKTLSKNPAGIWNQRKRQ